MRHILTAFSLQSCVSKNMKWQKKKKSTITQWSKDETTTNGTSNWPIVKCAHADRQCSLPVPQQLSKTVGLFSEAMRHTFSEALRHKLKMEVVIHRGKQTNKWSLYSSFKTSSEDGVRLPTRRVNWKWSHTQSSHSRDCIYTCTCMYRCKCTYWVTLAVFSWGKPQQQLLKTKLYHQECFIKFLQPDCFTTTISATASQFKHYLLKTTKKFNLF